MASYRYERDIDPADLAPRAEKQYTRKERWANWWDYNLKWVLLIGIAAAFVAYSFIGQYFFTTKPDYNVAVVAPYYLPDDTVTALQEQLARYGEDLNGDGVVDQTDADWIYEHSEYKLGAVNQKEYMSSTTLFYQMYYIARKGAGYHDALLTDGSIPESFAEENEVYHDNCITQV